MPPPVIWRGNTGLIPQWSGADLQLADRITDTDVYRGPIALCRYYALLRGTFGSGVNFDGTNGPGARLGWVVTSSTVNRERKGIGVLTIKWEVGGPWANSRFLPLDDFRSETIELYPKVERNKHMRGVSYPGNPNDRIAATTIALCYTAVHGVVPARDKARGEILNMAGRTIAPPTGTTWADQAAWGIVLLDWLDHGAETYYQAGTKYIHIWHSFTWPTLSNGGIIEPFPNAGPRAGDASLSWLRLADNPEPAGVNGSVFKITSTWLGGPGGHWDPILYS